jgi:hypothetical protein
MQPILKIYMDWISKSHIKGMNMKILDIFGGYSFHHQKAEATKNYTDWLCDRRETKKKNLWGAK